ncbi:MAG: coenzyme F420-0:L-glutamate ligase [Thermoprotei archaeon]|nr:MAG: coenzyme F420-0:L-glutamate ligase [Thermoprotei archaeon]
MAKKIELIGLETIPEVKKGDDIGELIVSACRRENVSIENGDIIIVTHKIVSKAEGRIVNLNSITPSKRALEIAKYTGKDPRLVELILKESDKIVKLSKEGHIIVRTKHGIVCANAGVDSSNIAGTEEIVALIPKDPDFSARKIRLRIKELTGKDVAVIITDTYGRPLREGMINMAIGISGISPFRDYRGKPDLYGYKFRVTVIAVADELASAAELLMGQGKEKIPVVVVKGCSYKMDEKASAKELNMPEEKWLFK